MERQDMQTLLNRDNGVGFTRSPGRCIDHENWRLKPLVSTPAWLQRFSHLTTSQFFSGVSGPVCTGLLVVLYSVHEPS